MAGTISLGKRLAAFLKRNAVKKTVVLVNSYDKMDEFAREIIPALSGSTTNITLLFFKSEIPQAFRSADCTKTLSEDYLEHDDYIRIDRHIFKETASCWEREAAARHPGDFIYRDIELGRIAEYDLQLFLVPRVKSVLVADRAIRREGYEAAFIADSNMELDGLDLFLAERYGITAEFFSPHPACSSPTWFREVVCSLVLGMTSFLSALSAGRSERPILIDAMLSSQISASGDNRFLSALFQRNLKLQISLFLARKAFLNFDYGQSLFVKHRKVAVDTENLASKFVFDGISYWTLVKNRIESVVRDDFRRFKNNIDIIMDAIDSRKIRSVITRNDVREIEKTVVLSCRGRGIPTLVIQHGILAEPNGHDTLFADKIAAWGDYSSGWYARRGNRPEKVVVVGNPAFDRILSIKNQSKPEGIPVLKNLSRKKYLITLITTGANTVRFSSFDTDDMSENLVRHVAYAVKSIGDANLIVKLHPNEDVKMFAKLIDEECGEFARIAEGVDLHLLLSASDLVITIDSTVGLEALLLGKPLVAVNMTKRETVVPYVERGVALGAYKAEDIEDAIREALKDDNAKEKMEGSREAFIKDFTYKTDGKSADRVRKLVADISGI